MSNMGKVEVWKYGNMLSEISSVSVEQFFNDEMNLCDFVVRADDGLSAIHLQGSSFMLFVDKQHCTDRLCRSLKESDGYSYRFTKIETNRSDFDFWRLDIIDDYDPDDGPCATHFVATLIQPEKRRFGDAFFRGFGLAARYIKSLSDERASMIWKDVDGKEFRVGDLEEIDKKAGYCEILRLDLKTFDFWDTSGANLVLKVENG